MIASKPGAEDVEAMSNRQAWLNELYIYDGRDQSVTTKCTVYLLVLRKKYQQICGLMAKSLNGDTFHSQQAQENQTGEWITFKTVPWRQRSIVAKENVNSLSHAQSSSCEWCRRFCSSCAGISCRTQLPCTSIQN